MQVGAIGIRTGIRRSIVPDFKHVILHLRLSSFVSHVVDFPRDVRVMPHHHVSAGVPQQLGNLSDAHAVDQSVGGETVAVGVSDQPLQVRKLLSQALETAANAVSSEGLSASRAAKQRAVGVLGYQALVMPTIAGVRYTIRGLPVFLTVLWSAKAQTPSSRLTLAAETRATSLGRQPVSCMAKTKSRKA